MTAGVMGRRIVGGARTTLGQDASPRFDARRQHHAATAATEAAAAPDLARAGSAELSTDTNDNRHYVTLEMHLNADSDPPRGKMRFIAFPPARDPASGVWWPAPGGGCRRRL